MNNEKNYTLDKNGVYYGNTYIVNEEIIEMAKEVLKQPINFKVHNFECSQGVTRKFIMIKNMDTNTTMPISFEDLEKIYLVWTQEIEQKEKLKESF